MRYQLIGKNDFLVNPIKIILNNRGIQNVEEFLNVNKSHTYPYSLLEGMDRAVNLLLTTVNGNNKIYIQVDSDCDGYTSAALMYSYIKLISPETEIIWKVHEGKQHGIILEEIPEDVSLVIIPDAGSNQIYEHKKLHERGIGCLVLDHHEVDEKGLKSVGNGMLVHGNPFAVIINNQTCDYPNKALSGVGIVYKFCQALDDKLGVKYADRFLDLVALGNIADVMDLRSLETRYYVLEGLQHIKNPFMEALFKKQEFSTKGVISIGNTAFYIVPLINACVRCGTQEEKEQMFKSFIGSQELVPYKKRGVAKEELVPIAEDMARVCTNVRVRQNKLRDKGTELLEQAIEEKNLLDNKILIVNGTDKLESTLTGLVATRLAEKYSRPTLILKFNEETEEFGGSGRGYDKGVIKDFRQLLLDTKKFTFVEGHNNAFGYSITGDNIVELNNLLNEQLKDVKFEDVYNVDFIVSSKNLDADLILRIDRYNNIWSHGAEEPLFAFTEITVDAKDIQIMGKSRNTIKIKYKDVEFIKFFCSPEEVETIENLNGTVDFDIVGKCKSNTYNGETTAQVVISDYIMKKSKKFAF